MIGKRAPSHRNIHITSNNKHQASQEVEYMYSSLLLRENKNTESDCVTFKFLLFTTFERFSMKQWACKVFCLLKHRIYIYDLINRDFHPFQKIKWLLIYLLA